MMNMDLDFANYIAHRRGLIDQRARDGAAYAYAGERKLRRALVSAKPVAIALEATSRMWNGSAKDEVLKGGQRVTGESNLQVFQAAKTASERLGLPMPTVVLMDEFPEAVKVLGVDDDPLLILRKDFVSQGLENAKMDELVAVIGHQLGHIQNDHVPYSTALFYLQHEAKAMVRWVVQPATLALKAWSRRAEISCDRAALLASRDLETTLSAVAHLALPGASPASRAEIVSESAHAEGAGGAKLSSLIRNEPDLTTRLVSIRWFSQSTLFAKVSGKENDGMRTEEVDAKVGERMGPL